MTSPGAVVVLTSVIRLVGGRRPGEFSNVDCINVSES